MTASSGGEARRRGPLPRDTISRRSLMRQVMKDPRLGGMMDPKPMPFDAKRMFWRGFKTLVAL